MQHQNLSSLFPQLTFRQATTSWQVLCQIRKKYVTAQPEELVRQTLLLLLTTHYKYPAKLIAVEKKITVNQQPKRFDIVCYNKTLQPQVLIECKAPNIPITQSTIQQLVAYQYTLKCAYLIAYNGTTLMVYNCQSQQYQPEIPLF